MQLTSLRSSDPEITCKLVPTPSTAVETLTRPTTMLQASTTCSLTDGTSRLPTTMDPEKFLRTLPHLTNWDTTHGDPTILSQETELPHTLVVKVVLHHGIVTTTDTPTDQDTLAPLTDTCTTCGVTGRKDLSSMFPTQVTTTTLTSSDSVGVKSMRTRAHRTDRTHTTTGVTTTPPTTVVRVPTSLLKDTPDTVVTTTSVWITLTAIT